MVENYKVFSVSGKDVECFKITKIEKRSDKIVVWSDKLSFILSLEDKFHFNVCVGGWYLVSSDEGEAGFFTEGQLNVIFPDLEV